MSHCTVAPHCLIGSHVADVLVWVLCLKLVSFLMLVVLLIAPVGNPLGRVPQNSVTKIDIFGVCTTYIFVSF